MENQGQPYSPCKVRASWWRGQPPGGREGSGKDGSEAPRLGTDQGAGFGPQGAGRTGGNHCHLLYSAFSCPSDTSLRETTQTGRASQKLLPTGARTPLGWGASQRPQGHPGRNDGAMTPESGPGSALQQEGVSAPSAPDEAAPPPTRGEAA